MTATTIPANRQDVNDDLRQVFNEGEEALRTHRQGLDRVFKIGRAFSALQREAMYRSGSNNPIGKRYNEAFAALVQPTPELTKVNKTDRAQYVWCFDHKAALEAWWRTLAENQRDRWGHPDTIKKQYLRANGEEKPEGSGTARELSPTAKRDEVIRQLQEERDELAARLRKAERETDRGPLLTPNAATEEAITVLRSYFSTTKGNAIAAGWLASYKREKATAKPEGLTPTSSPSTSRGGT